MKIKIKSEILYLFSVTLIALAVAVCMRADLGMSMIGAPAYILKIYTGLSMTLCEYIVQFIVFVLFCIVMRKFRVVYFTSFLTGLLYGAILKLFQLIPFFSDNYVGELNIWIRILLLVLAMVLTALSISLYKKTYMCPQIYDFFIIAVPRKYHLNSTKFKICYDFCFLIISLIMTLVLFHKLVGISYATVVMVICMGPLLGLTDKLADRFVETSPIFKKVQDYFLKDEID